MKLTGIKTSPVNQGQKSSKKEQARKTMQDIGDKMPMKDKLVGGAGGLGFVTGTAAKAAKGALGLIKNVLGKNTKKVPIIGKPGKTTTVPKSSTIKQVSYANPRISMTRAQREAAGY